MAILNRILHRTKIAEFDLNLASLVQSFIKI